MRNNPGAIAVLRHWRLSPTHWAASWLSELEKDLRVRMRSIATGVVGAGMILALASCTNPYDPGQRALGGAAIGAGTGAAIGGIAGGGTGAAIGAATGGAVGAITGAATTPPPPGYYAPPPPPPRY